MKVTPLYSLVCLMAVMAFSNVVHAVQLEKTVDVSYYGLSYVFDNNPYSNHGPIFQVKELSDKKMQVSVQGLAATTLSAECAKVAGQLDLEITDLGHGKSHFKVLPTTKINGKAIGQTNYTPYSFEVVALEPKHSSVKSLALSFGLASPDDEEEGLDLVFTYNKIAATLYTRDGDDDGGNVFELLSTPGEHAPITNTLDHKISARCY